MPWELAQLLLLLPAFMLVFVRMGAMMVAAPIFSSAAVPVRVRAAFALVLACVMFPVVAPQLTSNLSLSAALGAIVCEMIIGTSLGFGISLVFIGVEVAGMMIERQAGMALGRVYNPVMDSNSTIMGQMFFFLALAVFLAAGGLHALIRALLDSFVLLPPLSFGYSTVIPEALLALLQLAMQTGIRLAAPMLIALFLASIAMGFLSRTIPQINILSIGFAVRVMVALSATIVALQGADAVFVSAFSEGFEILRAVITAPGA